MHVCLKLTEYAEPFRPAPPSAILRFRFTHYQGEEHPGARKVTATVAVKDLFSSGVFSTPLAKHKFLLLAGPRWGAPNSDVVARLNDAREKGAKELDAAFAAEDLGMIKISSGDLAHEAQNVKWCSDKIDEMIAEANVRFLLTVRALVLRRPARLAAHHDVAVSRWPVAPRYYS